jgi:outer membrane protein TolC
MRRHAREQSSRIFRVAIVCVLCAHHLEAVLMPCLKRPPRCEGGAPCFVHFGSILIALLISFNIAAGQSPANPQAVKTEIASSRGESDSSVNVVIPALSWVEPYVDPAQGALAIDLVRRALASNAELAAARIEIDRARARLRQAGLRPNPSVDFERQNGVFNSPGESSTSVGFSLPLELAGQRGRRLDLAQAALEATFAEIADRERRLASDVRRLTPRLWRRCASWK